MEREHTVSAIQEADTDNPAAVESAAAGALTNTDITLPHPNEVQQVMNEAPVVYDDKDYDNFDENDIIFDVIIDKANNTDTQVDAEESVEDKEVNNKNDLLEDGNESNNDGNKTPYIQRYTRVIYLPNNLKPKISGGRVTYEEGKVNLQVEYMSKITTEVEKNNTVDNVIHTCMLQLSLKAGLKIFGKKGEEAAQK